MFISSLEASVGVVLIMALGYFLSRSGMFQERERMMMSKLVINVTLPATILSSFQNYFSRVELTELLPVFLVTVATMVLSLFLTWLIALIIRVPNRRRGQFMQSAVTSNSSFIGFPMVESVFGAAGNPPMVLLYFGQTLFTNTVGVMLTRRDAGVINGGGEKQQIGKILKGMVTPPTITIILSVVLALLGIVLPRFLMIAVDSVGKVTSPMALLFVGSVIYNMGFKNMKPERGVIAAVIFRLVISVVIIVALSLLVGMDPFYIEVMALQFGLSSAVQPVTMSKAYGADTDYSTKLLLYSVVGSVVTVPLVMMAVEMIVGA